MLLRAYCAVETFIVLRGKDVDEHEDELSHVVTEVTWESGELLHHVSWAIAWLGGSTHG